MWINAWRVERWTCVNSHLNQLINNFHLNQSQISSHTRRAADAGAAGPAGRGAGIHAAAGDGRHGEPQLLGPLLVICPRAHHHNTV